MERGTLYQLWNLIDRRNVTTNVKSDINAAEDFLETVVEGYIVAAVMKYLDMKSLDDFPDEDIVPPNIWMVDSCSNYREGLQMCCRQLCRSGNCVQEIG